ncbi:unnamed protein product [Symbiodinium sp. CCMP2592]|nr:unnamed protein product [Symbiodinium sp. CCMP2592]
MEADDPLQDGGASPRASDQHEFAEIPWGTLLGRVAPAAMPIPGRKMDAMVTLGRAIQQALRASTAEESVHILHTGPAETHVLIQVIFDHSRYNGQDLMQVLASHAEALEEISESREGNEQDAGKMMQLNEHITLRRIAPHLDPTASNLPDVGLSESLHAQILESPAARMPMKEVYREIARLFNSTFVIFIDLSHLFAGEPCMLRYTLHPDLDFDVQWDEIRALKRNAQGAVVQRWHLHLDRQERWATCLKAASSFWVPLYGNQKAESAEMQNITGVRYGTELPQSDLMPPRHIVTQLAFCCRWVSRFLSTECIRDAEKWLMVWMTTGLIAALLAFLAHGFDDGCSYVTLQQACLPAGGMLVREMSPFQCTTTTSTLSTTSSTVLPFDCSAGYSNRELSWSDAKKEWCCSNQQHIQLDNHISLTDQHILHCV